jgi:hypothetical protein
VVEAYLGKRAARAAAQGPPPKANGGAP